jgi:hypothetical protein
VLVTSNDFKQCDVSNTHAFIKSNSNSNKRVN